MSTRATDYKLAASEGCSCIRWKTRFSGPLDWSEHFLKNGTLLLLQAGSHSLKRPLMSNSHLSASGMKGLLPMLQLVSFKGTTSLEA